MSTTKSAFGADNINPSFLLHVLAGGAVAGGGVGLLNALLRQRKVLADQEKDQDNVIPLDLPDLSKSASESTMAWLERSPAKVVQWINSKVSPPDATKFTPDSKPLGGLDLALGGAALPLGFLGGLQLSRHAFQKWREQDVRARLAEEADNYQQALKEEAGSARNSKSASGRQPLSAAQLTLMALLGAPVLTGVTAGVLTDRFLDNQFPVMRPKKDPELRLNPVEEEDPALKRASAMEADFLVHLVLDGFSKSAAATGLSDVIRAVDAGMLTDLEDTMAKYGYDAMFDLSEKAPETTGRHQLGKCAAVHAALNSPIGNLVKLAAASAFADAAPMWAARGRDINREHVKLACELADFGGLAAQLHVWSSAAGAMPEEDIKQASAALAQITVDDLLALARGRKKHTEADTHASTLQSSVYNAAHSNENNQIKSMGADDNKPDPVDQMLVPVSN